MTVIIIMAVIRGPLEFCHFSTEIAKTTTPTPTTTYNNICIETNAFNDNDIKFYIFGRSPKNYATSSSLCSATPRLNSFTLHIHTIHNGMDWNECRRRWLVLDTKCLFIFFGLVYDVYPSCVYVCFSEQN